MSDSPRTGCSPAVKQVSIALDVEADPARSRYEERWDLVLGRHADV